jgi:glycosyltransferase involved in cell wall biosynthesis
MKIAIVSIYPEKGQHHIDGGGVASYTHNLAHSLMVNDNEVVVICNKGEFNNKQYIEDGIKIHRSFGRSIFYFFQIIKSIRDEKPEVVHVQQELGLYGNIINAFLLFFVLIFASANTLITLHGVVSMNDVTRKFVKENNSSMPVWLVKLAFKMIFIPLVFFSKFQIVHEQKFKKVLIEEYGAHNASVFVIPHGVEDVDRFVTEVARNKLGIEKNRNVVLFVGYLTGYKGIDLLIEGYAQYVKRYDSKALLLIGAGKHPKLKDDENYIKNSYNRLVEKAKVNLDAGSYKWVGFVSEDELSTYYSAASVTVFPYTVSMSSSGPMALSIAYETPFIASDVFEGTINNDKNLFKQNPNALSEKLKSVLSNSKASLRDIQYMREERQWSSVGLQHLKYYKKIYAEEKK